MANFPRLIPPRVLLLFVVQLLVLAFWPARANPVCGLYMSHDTVGSSATTRANRSRNSPDAAATEFCDRTRSTFVYRRVELQAINGGYLGSSPPIWRCYYGANSSTTTFSTTSVSQYEEGHVLGAPWSTCTPPPDPPAGAEDCNELANVTVKAWPVFTNTGSVPSDTYCMSGCEAFKPASQSYKLGFDQGNGKTFWNVDYRFTGMQCDQEVAPPAPTSQEPPPSGDRCADNANGEEFCKGENTAQSCGFLNGKYICVDKLEPDKCWVTSDGARICAEAAPMPPVPDSGTPGTPATPDGTMYQTDNSTSVNQTFNYYNTTTVAGSSVPAGSNGDPGSGSGVGPGSGSGEGEGDYPTGTASGGASCESAPTCSHDDPVQCALLQQAWKTRCTDVTGADALAAMGATEEEQAGELGVGEVDMGEWSSSGPLSGGACPAPLSVTVMGQSLSLDVWTAACDMALLFAPFVLAMGWFTGAMLFVRGGV